MTCLQVGKGVLGITFTGELNDKMKGFYRSKYSTPEGEERHAAVTQFEVGPPDSIATTGIAYSAVTQFAVSQ